MFIVNVGRPSIQLLTLQSLPVLAVTLRGYPACFHCPIGLSGLHSNSKHEVVQCQLESLQDVVLLSRRMLEKTVECSPEIGLFQTHFFSKCNQK